MDIKVINRADVHKFLGTLFQSKDEVREVRILGHPGGILVGYYKGSDISSLINHLAVTLSEGGGAYITLNPVNSDLYARAPAKLQRGIKAVRDEDIVKYRMLLLDIDPVRPSGKPATEEEKTQALLVADGVEDFLTQQGWPAPIRTDSGNGTHRIYSINLPNTGETKQIIKYFLEFLDFKFSTDKAKVDTSVYNPSRLIRVIGTLNRKGENASDRPHRISRVVSIPDRLEEIPREDLEALVKNYSLENLEQKSGEVYIEWPQDELEAFLRERVGVRKVMDWKDGVVLFRLCKCPMSAAHESEPDAYVLFWPNNGKLIAKCFHDSCKKAWKTKDFCEKLGIPFRKKKGNNGKSQADVLLQLVHDIGLGVFHTPAGEAFARVPMFENGEVSHWQVLSMSEIRPYLLHLFLKRTGGTISEEAARRVQKHLEAKAYYDGAVKEVFTRVAVVDGHIYISTLVGQTGES